MACFFHIVLVKTTQIFHFGCFCYGCLYMKDKSGDQMWNNNQVLVTRPCTALACANKVQTRATASLGDCVKGKEQDLFMTWNHESDNHSCFEMRNELYSRVFMITYQNLSSFWFYHPEIKLFIHVVIVHSHHMIQWYQVFFAFILRTTIIRIISWLQN